MASWVVGDIHGCARELEHLLERLGLGANDRLISVGDLFHRGPDACGVMELMEDIGALFILGNHEHALLERCGLAPGLVVAQGQPPTRTRFPLLLADDLAGDGRRALTAPPERLPELLHFIQGHAGYFLEHTDIPFASDTIDRRAWCVVHAGRTPGCEAAESKIDDLIYPARLSKRRGPFWFQGYQGPKLVLYGHLPLGEPRRSLHEGKLVALGLDTGCVYGGRLTAYSPELDRFESVAAEKRYAQFS
ncbi:MAG: hypothetical protein CMJ89_02570 [Planctomycetes bacterium]|jgi:hypothetical protein|nr:hypothetical protein [Planctomycetota bacterium]